MSLVSDIKLIRTNTTLDLSQKAEKGMHFFPCSIDLHILCSYTQSGNLYGINETWASFFRSSVLVTLAQERSGIAAVPSRSLSKLAGSRGSGTWGGGGRGPSSLALFFALTAILPGLRSGGACDFSFHLFILRACCDIRLHIAVWLPT